MPERITIAFEGVSVQAELNDSPCAQAILRSLPVEARVSTWGEEIYFPLGVALEAGDGARSDMAVGEIGYWPDGQAFCIFFGQTPASAPNGPPRAASDVEPVGCVVGAVDPLRRVRSGQRVRLSVGA